MKKIILMFFILFNIINLNAQNSTSGVDVKASIGGMFENVFDQYGNKYNLADIKIETPKKSKINEKLLLNTLTCTSGIFDLYFESGCGMEVVTNSTQNALNTARRNVACQVFNDLSSFINSPLKNIGNTERVKIWVRNIDQVTSSSNNVLGLATSFYNMPYNTNSSYGGIADNEIWKTIHSGNDSYINVVPPIYSNGGNSGLSGLYYHGMMSFNFNTITNWNTNLGINTPSGLYDLYSVILHEVTHALGFASLISANGTSKFGVGYNYYSRYDRFLKNNNASQFLISNTGSCNLYNYSFNPLLTNAILQPNTPCISQQTTCSTSIKYVGSSIVPVYTPNCFEPPSSLSHFEDQCIGEPNGNNANAYFVMTDANDAGVTKRFLKPEERNALGDIGYSLNSTFGNNTLVLNSFKNYNSTTTGINVAGINDGINADNNLMFFGSVGNNISINGILSNDFNATGFECLQDTYSSSTLSVTSGTASTNISFNSTIGGLHLLRYVPINNAGQKGNITYIYVYVIEVGLACGTSSVCNLIVNGDFEVNNGIPTQQEQFNNICNWKSVAVNKSNEYYHTQSSTTSSVKIPCNSLGFENVNNSGNAYAGMVIIKDYNNGSGIISTYTEIIGTKLSTPLMPLTNYQLSIDVSLADGFSSNAIKFQAYFSNTPIITIQNNYIPITNTTMLITNIIYSEISDGWQKVILNFTTGVNAGESYLYIGALNNTSFKTKSAGFSTGCQYFNGNTTSFTNQGYTYYYVDNVQLTPLNTGKLNLPESLCLNSNFNNLGNYLIGISSAGVFSGNGVSFSNGIYNFNSTTTGLGTNLITYTYTNTLGCLVNLYSNINVSDCSLTICPSDLVFDNPQVISSANYQAITSIITNTNYLVNPNSTITLKSGNYITMSPLSEVKVSATSSFNAQIANCIETSTIEFKKNQSNDSKKVKNKIDVIIYPNPFDKIFTIQVEDDNISKIQIITLEGKIIFDIQNIASKIYDVQTQILPNGIYIVYIETESGIVFNKKIIKN